MIDWASPSSRVVNASGSKARVGVAKCPYSDWRRTVGGGCYANDIDWIEWRIGRSGPAPVAVIETTFYEDIPRWREKLPDYCCAALQRFKRDGQHGIVMLTARALDVPAYFVIARYDLAMFFVCRLVDEQWRRANEDQYRRWIKSL